MQHIYSLWNQAPVVQTLDSAIHRINHYPADKYYGNQLRYPLDSAIQRLNNWGLMNSIKKINNNKNHLLQYLAHTLYKGDGGMSNIRYMYGELDIVSNEQKSEQQ